MISPQQPMVGNLLHFGQMQQLLFAFERALTRHGITIQKGTDLERSCLAVMEILAKHEQPSLMHPLEDIRPYFTDVLGIWAFMNKVARLNDHPDFALLVPHLRLLNKGDVKQNARSPVSDQANDKLFELLIALVCLEAGTDLLVDDPDRSKGDNPDILVTLNGERWGFACKTLYSQSSETLFQRVCEGIDQIERSSANIGCVIVNCKNLIDHNSMWPILNELEVSRGAQPLFGCWQGPVPPGAILARVALAKQHELQNTIGQAVILDSFRGKKSLPAVCFWMQTATGLIAPTGQHVPSSVGAFFAMRFADIGARQVALEKLNHGLQSML